VRPRSFKLGKRYFTGDLLASRRRPGRGFRHREFAGLVDFLMGKIDVFRCCGQLLFVERMLVCAAPIYFAAFLRRVVFVGEALCLRFSRGRRTCGSKVGLCEFV
jgi:hypothetical protein